MKLTKKFIQEYSAKCKESIQASLMCFRPITKRCDISLPELEVTEKKGVKQIFLPDVVVGVFNEGCVAYPFACLAKRACCYDADILLQTPRKNSRKASGKSIMNMLYLELFPGSLVDLTVTGDNGDDMRESAFYFYTGITTQGEKPDFDRYGSFDDISFIIKKEYRGSKF